MEEEEGDESRKSKLEKAAMPTSTVEISISCRNLMDVDVLSKSDPMCVVYNQPRGAGHFVELLRTETIQDNLDPDFSKKVTLPYRFEEQQPLRFEVYDVDDDSPNLGEQDFIGYLECTVANVVAAGPAGFVSSLYPNPFRPHGGKEEEVGTIILIAEEMAGMKEEVTLRFGANEVGTVTCCLCRPNLIYTISKENEAGKVILVHRSDSVSSSNPTWKQVTLPVRNLCNGDKERRLRVEVLQLGMAGMQDVVGYCNTTLNHLVKLGTGGIRLVGEEGLEDCGTLVVLQCKIKPIYTFMDYIQHGTQINACFAIDFTSSNGDPKESSSLHHFSEDDSMPNPYEQAIKAVGTIVQDYDSDKRFPVYGFGAQVPPKMEASHNFYVTLTNNSYCFGIPGVMEAYKNCTREVKLYGPTCFSPIINHVAEMAAGPGSQNGEHYYILLIITDGVITDMESTKEAIVNAATLPLSIIIVGVGNADYTAMEELDGDSVRISYNGRMAARDIVQFVPYKDAKTWLASTERRRATIPQPVPTTTPRQTLTEEENHSIHKLAQMTLAQEVLEEIPRQITSYMKSRGILPGKYRSGSSRSRLFDY